MTDLQAELPAASNARTVTAFVPTRSGTCAVHAAVPDATPEKPREVDHWTEVTPTLSEAVPLMGRDVADVDRIVTPGERMVSDGGVVSGVAGAGAVGVAGVEVEGVVGVVGAAGWR